MRRLSILTFTTGLTLSSLAASATTWTVQDPTWTLDGNSKSYASQAACVSAAEAMAMATYHCTSSGVATIIGSSGTTTSGGTTSTTTSTGTSWVYHDGTFFWPGDWSWSGTANYKDTSGLPTSGSYDVAFHLSGQWGGWLPYAPNRSFSLAPYKYMILSIKTTVANQPIHIFFDAANDTPIGTFIDPVAGGFGAKPVVGQWTLYKIPLSAFGISGATILKFGVQDDSGGSGNTFYVDDVGFTTS